MTITTNDLWQKSHWNVTPRTVSQFPGFQHSLTSSKIYSQKASKMNNLFLNLFNDKFIVKLAKVNVLNCIPSSKWYSSVCREQLLHGIYFKMKQSIQSNQWKILLLLSSLMLGERAFLSNLIPLHLFKSLAYKQKV